MISYDKYIEGRRLAPRIANKLKESERPEDSLSYWQGRIEDSGVEYVEAMLAGPLPVSQLWYIPAQYAVDEYHHRKQAEQSSAKDRKEWSRDRLAQEAVDHAREANPIAERGVRETRNAWVAAVLVGLALGAIAIWAELRS